MRLVWIGALLLSVMPLCGPRGAEGSEELTARWAGRGQYRLLLKVTPVNLDGRNQDELPADVEVDPIDGDTERDFVALQGARTVLAAADFEGDGLNDLVVGDTYGKVRYFRNLGPASNPRFAEPVLVGDMGFRLLVDAADWDGDGRVDVIAGASNHRVSVFLNLGGDNETRFADELRLKLPQIKETRTLIVDLNRDGDQDLFVMSTQGTILVERSFLKHGYARGEVLRLERKPGE